MILENVRNDQRSYHDNRFLSAPKQKFLFFKTKYPIFSQKKNTKNLSNNSLSFLFLLNYFQNISVHLICSIFFIEITRQ